MNGVFERRAEQRSDAFKRTLTSLNRNNFKTLKEIPEIDASFLKSSDFQTAFIF